MKKAIGFLLISSLLFSIATGLFLNNLARANFENKDNSPSYDVPSDDWPMFLYNAAHTSSPDDVALVTHDLLWRFNTMPEGGDNWIISSSPAIVDGVVYVGSDDGCFYALDSSNGNCLWNQTLGEFTVSSPAIVDGVVYVSVWEGCDYALNASTGSVIWNSSRWYSSSSPAVVNGLHYICAGNGSVIARNATTGNTIWQTAIPSGGECSPVVVNGTVYISGSGNACALDAATGNLKWTRAMVPGNTYNAPAVANGILYFGCESDSFYAIDANSGADVWTYSDIGYSDGSTPTVAEGVVYVGSLTKGVFALNASNGAKIWNYPASIWDSSFAVAGGTLYACNSEGIHALDTKTGDQMWSYAPSNTNINSAPAVSNGVLYVKGGDGYIYAFGKANQASIALSPQVNLAGTTVSISGAGFTSNSMVTATFGGQPVTLSNTAVDSLGHFAGNFQIDISTTPRIYQISIADSAGVTACANFTVVGNPTTSWPMFMHDLQHSGTADKIPITNHDLLWKYTVDRGDIMNCVDSSPAVVNGILYEGSQNGFVYALDSFTGTCYWRFNTGCSNLPSPVVVDGVVYIATLDGVYAVNAYTGEQIWKTIRSESHVSTPAVSGGILYVGSMIQHCLYAFRTSDGQVLWQYPTNDYVNSSPAVYGSTVYVGGNDGYIYAIDAATGKLRWKFNGGGTYPSDAMSAPVVYDNVVYTSCYDGNVFALNAIDGSVIWNHTTTMLQSIYASPTLSNDAVYLSAGNGVYALNTANGSELWHFTTDDQFPIQASPTIVGGVIYVGGNNGNIYALDAVSGSELWRYNTGSPIISSVTIDHGVLYLGLRSGAIIALGTPDFTTPQPTPTPSPTPTSTANPTTTHTQTTTGTPTSHSTITTTPQPSETPNSSGVIKATTDQGINVELPMTGNITSAQISNATLTTNQTASKTIITFTITGQTGTTGFANITIPKHMVPNGESPVVYVSGELCQDQGYTQDSDNFYVWYLTHFSTHQVDITFTKTIATTTPSSAPQNPLFQSGSLVEIAILGSIIGLAAVLVAALLLSKKRVKNKPKNPIK